VKALFFRWLKFNFVGGIGIVVQLAALWLLMNVARLHYLVATALAVEIAVLHNFVWHETFTWSSRIRAGWRARSGRLLRFHAGNGLISIAGNLALMRVFTGSLGIRPLMANAAAIAICSLANFAAGEWFVFRESRR
jgi:putative flippase GtrA